MTKVILLFGFSILVGSFAFYGESLKPSLGVAALPSEDNQDICERCFEKNCKGLTKKEAQALRECK